MNIHQILAAGALSLGLIAGTQALAAPEAGPPVDGTVNIDGSVAAKCLFTGSSTVAIHLGELGDGQGHLDTSKIDGQTANLTGWCNSAGSKMHVEASELVLTPVMGTVPTGFTQVVDYTASAVANAQTATNTSSATPAPGADVTVGIFSSTIPVTLSASSSTGLLLAGAYQATVTVTLTPG